MKYEDLRKGGTVRESGDEEANHSSRDFEGKDSG